jgi:hypothetical protein
MRVTKQQLAQIILKPNLERMRTRPRTRPTPGAMNKLEQRYADSLRINQLAGRIISYRFEPIKFRLANKTFYTPDFMVTRADQIEFHEVKGFWEDDARVKIKVVAEMYPEFAFVAVQWKNKMWVRDEIS